MADDEKPNKKPPAVPVWVWVLVGVLGLGLISFAFDDAETTEPAPVSAGDSGVDSTGSPESSDPDSTSPEDAVETAGIGDTVTTSDGVSVTIVEVAYGVDTPNNWIVDEPKGELASIRLEIFNGGDEPMSISSSSLVALVDEAEYSAAAVFGDDGEWYVYEDLNPQLGVGITAYFDVPPQASFTGAVFETSIIFGSEASFSF